jgi:hypothetical protein
VVEGLPLPCPDLVSRFDGEFLWCVMADPPRVPDNVPCSAFLRAFGLLDVLRRTERLFWEESSSDLSGQTRKRGREAERSKRSCARSSDRWNDLEDRE